MLKSHYLEILSVTQLPNKRLWRQRFSPFCSLNGTFSLNFWIKKLDSIEADRIWENPLKHKEKDELKLEKRKTLMAQTQEAIWSKFSSCEPEGMKAECVWFCFFHPDFYDQPAGLMEVKKTQQNPYSFHIFKKNIWIFSDVERLYVWKNKKRIPFHHSKECIFGFLFHFLLVRNQTGRVRSPLRSRRWF